LLFFGLFSVAPSGNFSADALTVGTKASYFTKTIKLRHFCAH